MSFLFTPGVILIANLGSTWFMAGLIWFVQVVHYPQFAGVGTEAFAAYHRRHTAATTWVVGPPMLLEAITSVLLLVTRPMGLSYSMALVALVLLGIVWASTALLQVPLHNRLAAGGFDAALARRLCRSNWIRTIGWTARGVIVAVGVARSMG